jgi:hypothetical protein
VKNDTRKKASAVLEMAFANTEREKEKGNFGENISEYDSDESTTEDNKEKDNSSSEENKENDEKNKTEVEKRVFEQKISEDRKKKEADARIKPRQGEETKGKHVGFWEVFTLGVYNKKTETWQTKKTEANTKEGTEQYFKERFGVKMNGGIIRRLELENENKTLKKITKELETIQLTEHRSGLLFASLSEEGSEYSFGGETHKSQGWPKTISKLAKKLSHKLNISYKDVGIAAYVDKQGPRHKDNEQVYIQRHECRINKHWTQR